VPGVWPDGGYKKPPGGPEGIGRGADLLGLLAPTE